MPRRKATFMPSREGRARLSQGSSAARLDRNGEKAQADSPHALNARRCVTHGEPCTWQNHGQSRTTALERGTATRVPGRYRTRAGTNPHASCVALNDELQPA